MTTCSKSSSPKARLNARSSTASPATSRWRRHCVKRGYFLSFSGTVTFKNAAATREAASVVPLDQLLVETDAPFLTPTPYRGRPNAPYLVPITVRALAAVKGVDEDEIAAATAANAERVFGPWD